MTTLAEIWTDAPILPHWAQQQFTGFCLDSRMVQTGNIFIALKGVNHDLAKTKDYLDQARVCGAIGVLTEIEELSNADGIYYVPNLRHILGQLQQNLLQAQQPQQLARTVAVTGTNGKTTVSRLIAELLTMLGQPTAVMGTTGNGILPKLEPQPIPPWMPCSFSICITVLVSKEQSFLLWKLALMAWSRGVWQAQQLKWRLLPISVVIIWITI